MKKIILIKLDLSIFLLVLLFDLMISFKRNNFFPCKKKFNIKELNSLISSEIVYTNSITNFNINDISSLNNQRKNSILFLEKEVKNSNFNSDNLHIYSDVELNKNHYKNISIVRNIDNVYNKILNELFYHDDQKGFNDKFDYINGSYISKYSIIHDSCEIGKNCTISRGVEIGKNSIIKNNVVIKNSLIGNNVIISDNTSIGTTGFGFNLKKRGSTYLNPQIGIVIIDDNVHIGSSCTIDRGKLDFTHIGKNSMIDNMVHIGHNVILGENACIAAQTGISGSVVIGNNVTIGGQVGFAGHINIGKNVVIAARSGVTKNIKDNSVVAGFPATDMKEWKKNLIRQRKNGH